MWLNGEFCDGTRLLREGDIFSFRPRREPDKIAFCMALVFCLENYRYHWEKVIPDKEIRELLVGRREDAPLSAADEYMSERHASFFNSRQGWSLIDFGSTNGVYVNNQKISQPVLLQPMDLIRIGNTWFYFTKDVLWCGKLAKTQAPETAIQQKQVAALDIAIR